MKIIPSSYIYKNKTSPKHNVLKLQNKTEKSKRLPEKDQSATELHWVRFLIGNNKGLKRAESPGWCGSVD